MSLDYLLKKFFFKAIKFFKDYQNLQNFKEINAILYIR